MSTMSDKAFCKWLEGAVMQLAEHWHVDRGTITTTLYPGEEGSCLAVQIGHREFFVSVYSRPLVNLPGPHWKKGA